VPEPERDCVVRKPSSVQPPPSLPPRPEAIARLIDANANRAREALRMLEDTARFALDDADLASGIKALRHELTAALAILPEQLGEASRLLARDTPGDVGVEISTEAEGRRATLADAVSAAGSRLGEAMRVLEETAKTGSPDAARRIEQARYAGYELARRVRLRLGSTGRRQWRLCVLLTESLCRNPWERVAAEVIGAGADCIQLREKDLPDRELLARARRLVSMANEAGVSVVVNDRPDIALLSGSAGVHVGQDDLSVHEVRRVVGFGVLVGVSTTDLGQARSALEAGADNCGLGPMFRTSTKNKPRIAGPEYASAYLADPALSAVPHLAIGGITPVNARQLAALGVRGVAVSSAVCGAENPGEVCGEILAGLC